MGESTTGNSFKFLSKKIITLELTSSVQIDFALLMKGNDDAMF